MDSVMTLSQATTAPTMPADVAHKPVIDIEGLSVSYGDVKAVRNISLQVNQGEIFGIVGPNGAGKTTTLSTIEGIVKPGQGTVKVLGLDVQKHTNGCAAKAGHQPSGYGVLRQLEADGAGQALCEYVRNLLEQSPDHGPANPL